MNITLSPDQAAFVQHQIEDGQYIDVDALIGDAIALLADQGINIDVLSDFNLVFNECGLVGVEGDVHGG